MNDFKLDMYPKMKSGFTVPKDYFTKIDNEILSKVSEDIPIILVRSKRESWVYAAAAILLLSLTIPIIGRFQFDAAKKNKAIENYFAHADISDEDLVNLLDLKDIQKINVENKIEDKTIEDVLSSNSNLENYITD